MGKLTFVLSVLALTQTFNNASGYGYGTSGRDSSSTTSAPSREYGNEEQWGGVGHGSNSQQQSNFGRSTENYGEDSQRYENNGNPNYFARESHIERYGSPEGCVNERDPARVCNYYVEIAKDLDRPGMLHFELTSHMADSGGYVAVGISKDQIMGEDHMVECVKQADGRTAFFHSWAKGRTRPLRLRADPKIITMDHNSPYYDEREKLLTCKFTRPIVTYVEIPDKSRPEKIDLVQGKYYILLARGPLDRAESDQVGYHGDQPVQNGHAYVSQNLLGYSQEHFVPTTAGDTSGRVFGSNTGYSGQAVESSIYIFLCAFIILFY